MRLTQFRFKEDAMGTLGAFVLALLCGVLMRRVERASG